LTSNNTLRVGFRFSEACPSGPVASQIVQSPGIFLTANPTLNIEQTDKPSLMSTELVNKYERGY
jgi:hypothetical protein